MAYNRMPDTILTGTLAVTDTAAALGDSTGITDMVLQADPDNGAVDVFVGNADLQPIQLSAGQTFSILANNISLLYCKTATGTATINWIGRRDGVAI